MLIHHFPTREKACLLWSPWPKLGLRGFPGHVQGGKFEDRYLTKFRVLSTGKSATVESHSCTLAMCCYQVPGGIEAVTRCVSLLLRSCMAATRLAGEPSKYHFVEFRLPPALPFSTSRSSHMHGGRSRTYSATR